MRKLTLSLAVLAALLPGQGQTLGLGEIELKSALNQELDAEIEVLSAAPEDAEQLIVKLADRDAFARAGIDRPFQLQQLKFKVFLKEDKPYVRVFTQSAIKEPFLSFLVEIDWPEGHMLREYTLLLDPPVYSGVETTQSGRPAEDDGERPFIDPAEQAFAQPVTAQQAGSRPAQRYEPMGQPSSARAPIIESYSAGGEVTYRAMPQAKNVSGSYRVKQNDTLWSMANRFRPDASISVEQMMLAMVRENPEAFIEENIHGVKRGYILRMPDRNSITSINRQQALAQVREHASLWREYRQSMTGAPASAMEAEQGPGGSQQPMEMTTDGQLSIVSASETEGGEADIAGQDPNAELSKLRSQLSMARESLESERLEKENLRARLNELEQRVTRVLEMDDSELAKLQMDLQGTKQEIEAAAEPVEAEIAEPEMPVEEAQITTEDSQVTDEAPLTAEGTGEEAVVTDTTAEEPAVIDEAAQLPAEEPLFVDEAATKDAAEVTAETEAAEVATPAMPDTTAPAFVQTESKTFIEKLLEQPSMLAAVGGAILAVIALIALVIRRKRVNKAEDEWVAPETDSFDDLDEDATVQMGALDATMKMAADDAGQEESAFDEGLEDTVMGLQDSAAQAEEEPEQDDVLAEADVYLAYGIYQQAEDLLKSAIASNPERDDYRMKLLETHFAAKNSDAFADMAVEVKQRKGGDKSYWDRVVLMGRELCPSNALFEAGGLDVAGLDTDDLLPQKPETTDLELDAGEMDSDATQILSEPLDLGSFEEESTDTALEGLGDLSDDLSGFDDDLSLDETTDELAEDLEFNLDDLAESETAEAESDDGGLDVEDDFALDFEASDLGLEESTKAIDAEPDMDLSMDIGGDEELDLSMDMDAGGDDEMSLDMGGDEELDLSMDMDAGGDDEMSLDMGGDEELDLSMDMDAGGDDEMSLDMGGDEELDLSMDMDIGGDDEMSLDMGGDEELDLSMDMDIGDSGDEISIDAGDDDFDISSLSEDVDEVGTKLELARAYLEMGDKEGARSILDEVKQEGNNEQQKEAEELLQQAS
ncbi:MAG: hypothetical protein OEY61_11055 [Gammaproteobacteria bacterium]|nr:hypothetical protein [Gammaproteobacteria bacterium]